MGKKVKRKSLIEAELQMEKLLVRVGYTGKYKGKSLNEIPNYKIASNIPATSDVVGNGPKHYKPSYTGDEILGVTLNHKSNYEPVRKDNKQAAVDSAQMRRS
jgi:hypothetical protein